MTRPITFPKLTADQARNTRPTYRNAETGVTIQKTAVGAWAVAIPVLTPAGYRLADSVKRTLAEARVLGADAVDKMRARIAADHDEAYADDAQRTRSLVPAYALYDSTGIAYRMFSASVSSNAAGDYARSVAAADVALYYAVEAAHAEALREDAWREVGRRNAAFLVDEAHAEAQVDAWRARHDALGTDVSRDAYPEIAYRRADHEEALRDDARYNRAVTLDAAAYRRGIEDVVAAVDASPGIYATHVRRAVDAADAEQEGVTQVTTWLDRHGIDSATHDAVRAATDVDHADALAWEQQYSEHGRGPAVKFDYNPGTEFVTHHDMPAEEEDTMTNADHLHMEITPSGAAKIAAVVRRNQRPDLYDRAAARTGNAAANRFQDAVLSAPSIVDPNQDTIRIQLVTGDPADRHTPVASVIDSVFDLAADVARALRADRDAATPTYRNDYPTTPLAPAVGSVQARLNGTVMADSVQAYLDAETRPGRAQRVGPVSVRYCHAIYDGISHAISYTDADTGAEEILQLTASTSVAQTAQLMQAVA